MKSTPQSVQRNSYLHPMRLRNLQRQPNYTPFKQLAAQHLLTQSSQHPLMAAHIYTEEGTKLNIDKLIIKEPKIWKPSVSNELGRLANGVRDIEGNNAIVFIQKSTIPSNKKITYANMVCDFRPGKDDPYRTRLTIGGDKLDYYGNSASPAASLLETKLIINSVISDSHKGARFDSLDIKDHFLQSHLPEPEYMRIHSKYFFSDIRQKYDIDNIIDKDGYVYCKIIKGMYGLKQAAKLGRENIIKVLQPFGYEPDPMSPNIWTHTTRPTKFCLCVDDFGVKYFSKDDLQHLIDALQSTFLLSIDLEGKKYCGLKFNWNYNAGYVDISMPTFVKNALEKLQHPSPTKQQHSPHRHIPPQYGQQQKFVPPPDKSTKLGPTETTHIQRIVGSFLYYGRAVDPTILPAINEIGYSQAQPTQQTQDKCKQLLDYLYTHPTATLRYHKTDMQLYIDSDAAYLVAPGAKSRIAGYFYCSSTTQNSTPTTIKQPLLNSPIHVECKTLKHVVSSAAEAETGGLFSNCHFAISIKYMLQALDHKQGPIPIKTDNQTASAFVNNTLKAKRSKTWDMRYFWLKDRVSQSEFIIYWDKGSNNHADYWTKHWPAKYHQQIRPTYILKGNHLQLTMNMIDTDKLRGCVENTLYQGKNTLLKGYQNIVMPFQSRIGTRPRLTNKSNIFKKHLNDTYI